MQFLKPTLLIKGLILFNLECVIFQQFGELEYTSHIASHTQDSEEWEGDGVAFNGCVAATSRLNMKRRTSICKLNKSDLPMLQHVLLLSSAPEWNNEQLHV